MNLIAFFTAACWALSLGIIAAWLGILGRYAIPRAPKIFHILLTVPMLVSAAAVGGVGLLAVLPEETTLFGFEMIVLAIAHLVSQVVVWWLLIAYAVYHQFRGTRRCPY